MAEGRFALIIANSRFNEPDLHELPESISSAKKLAAVLSDPSVGGFEVNTLMDQPSYVVNEEIEAFFSDRERNDLLLLYYSGNGIKVEDGDLYFATIDSKFKRFRSTTVPVDFVADIMNRSISKQQIVILDCFFMPFSPSGATSRRYEEELQLEDKFVGYGKEVIISSNSVQYSFDTFSIFSKPLTYGLRTGEADLNQDGIISIDEIYDYVYDHIRSENPKQKLMRLRSGKPSNIMIAKVPRQVIYTTPKDLPKKAENENEYLLKLLIDGKVAEFNDIREKDSSITLDLHQVTLQEKDLSGVNLRGANLHMADIRKAKLTGANLAEADLKGANLAEADLKEANLAGAILTGANLRGANLWKTNTKNTIFDNADLAEANLKRVDLFRKNLFGVNFIDANLKEANLAGAILTGANLRGADLTKANLRGADLSGSYVRTDVSEARLVNADLTEARLSLTDFTRSNLKEAFLINTILVEAIFNECNLTRADLTNAKIANADLIYAKLDGATLTRATLNGCNISGATLIHADLSYADLSRADLSSTLFQYTNLEGAYLRNAYIPSTTIFQDSNLKDADFRDALIDSPEIVDYLSKNNARNVPYPITDKELMKKKRQESIRKSSLDTDIETTETTLGLLNDAVDRLQVDDSYINLKKGKEIIETIPLGKLNRLSDYDVRLIKVLEQSMEKNFRIWAELYSQRSSTDPVVKDKTDLHLREVAKNMCKDWRIIVNFLKQTGIDIGSHYRHIETICEKIETEE